MSDIEYSELIEGKNGTVTIPIGEYKELIRKAAGEAPLVYIPIDSYVEMIRQEERLIRENEQLRLELNKREFVSGINETYCSLRAEIRSLRGDLAVEQTIKDTKERAVEIGRKRVPDSGTQERR